LKTLFHLNIGINTQINASLAVFTNSVQKMVFKLFHCFSTFFANLTSRALFQNRIGGLDGVFASISWFNLKIYSTLTGAQKN